MNLEKMKADAEPVAWQIQYTQKGLGCTLFCGHNCVADYRDIDPTASSRPLYAQSSQPSPELLAVVEAADNYYRRYAQDEASEDGCEVTGCTLSQHEDAVALRDALTALEAA